MDARFNTQAGIYAILEQADAVPGVLDVAIGRWLAWPAIKVLIYARLFNAIDDRPMGASSPKRALRGASLGSRLPSTWLRLGSVLSALPRRTERPRVAWMTGSYARRGVDGVAHDAIFGDLPSELAPHAEQIWLHPPLLSDAAAGVHAESVYDTATDWANQLSSLQRFRPAVRAAAAMLADKLTAVMPDVRGLSWQQVCLDALAMFEARRIAWTKVFEHLRPDLVIMTNAPYLSGEVAAAKSLGVAVAEFQHGLFGPRCPEYGWLGALALQRARMPVADQLFVFGELFKGAALKNGFWRADEVRAIGSAAIQRIRDHQHAAASTNKRLVFLTQPATSAEAIALWRRVLEAMQAETFPATSVTIKVHPSERHRVGEYETLATAFPSLCRVAGPDEDAIRVMLEHDIVVGYTSYGLIEAVGLGRAAISISGEQTPGGVFALCPIPGAATAIPTVSSVDELANAIERMSAGADSTAAIGFFAPQPSGLLRDSILDLLRRRRASVPAA